MPVPLGVGSGAFIAVEKNIQRERERGCKVMTESDLRLPHYAAQCCEQTQIGVLRADHR